MRSRETHISDEDLVRAADGELSSGRTAEIRGHLTSCWSCRARAGEFELAIEDFVRTRRRTLDPLLPPPDTARKLLQYRMAEQEAVDPRWLGWNPAALRYAVPALVALAAILLFQAPDTATPPYARSVPDPSLTPGATLPVTRDDICAAGMAETVRLVPPPVAKQVFAAYGIREPRPRAYELDYLISPALGGSDHILNFWPQPYGNTVWTAHIKDALEDHLYRLVCAGQLELATAQREISQDWIAAYRKYFRTESPLPEHVSFLKDRPWE